MPVEITLMFFAVSVAFALFAGLVKGITGFAMPMILISGIGSFLPPETALAGLILPTLVTNFWQAIRQGFAAALSSAAKHWRYLLICMICLVTSAQFVTLLPTSVLFLILGIPVTLFAVVQLLGWRPKIAAKHQRKAELGIGAFAGGIGGLSGVWGPPTVLYLTALNVPKVEHVRVQGVVYAAGSVMLMLAHLNSGVLTAERLTFSAALIVPAVLGMVAGFSIQDRLDQDKFRWAILIVLTVAGLNLIRRGLFG